VMFRQQTKPRAGVAENTKRRRRIYL